jgi:hypothetical protein
MKTKLERKEMKIERGRNKEKNRRRTMVGK